MDWEESESGDVVVTGNEAEANGVCASDWELEICVTEEEKPELCEPDPAGAGKLDPPVGESLPAVVDTVLALLKTPIVSDVIVTGKMVVDKSVELEVAVAVSREYKELDVRSYTTSLVVDGDSPVSMVDAPIYSSGLDTDAIVEDCDEGISLGRAREGPVVVSIVESIPVADDTEANTVDDNVLSWLVGSMPVVVEDLVL